MLKKSLLGAFAAVAFVLSFSASALEPQIVGVTRTEGYDALGQKLERTVIVHDDGSIIAMYGENGSVASRMNVRIQGNQTIITETTPWGVSTRVLDNAGLAKYMADNPLAANAAKQSYERVLAAWRTRETNISTGMPALDPCGSQQQAMVTAGLNMDIACSGGDMAACSYASGVYLAAVNVYNACMRKNHKLPPT